MSAQNIIVKDPSKGFLGNENDNWSVKGKKLQDALQAKLEAMKAGDSSNPTLLAEYMAANNDVVLFENARTSYIKTVTDMGKLKLSKD